MKVPCTRTVRSHHRYREDVKSHRQHREENRMITLHPSNTQVFLRQCLQQEDGSACYRMGSLEKTSVANRNTVLHIKHTKSQLRHNPFTRVAISSYFVLPYVYAVCTEEQEQCYVLSTTTTCDCTQMQKMCSSNYINVLLCMVKILYTLHALLQVISLFKVLSMASGDSSSLKWDKGLSPASSEQATESKHNS